MNFFKSHAKNVFIGTGLILAAVNAHATPMVGILNATNLDLTGDFTYAVTMNPDAAGTTVGNATFTYALDGNTAGVSVVTDNYIQDWHSSAAAQSVGLDGVMRSIVWSYGDNYETLKLSMSNLTVGDSYKVQLLFGEACCQRGFDILHNGVKVADNVSPFGLNNPGYEDPDYVNYDYYGTAIFSDTFVANSTVSVFGFGFDGGFADVNPILNAATLEHVATQHVPEPSSLALLLAGLGLVGFRARKKA